ncbi:MAG: hypothetical protein ACR2NT_14905 [Acidimicrobiia bacterium]|nr:hypothetical protein [Acidimicrobiia bacterium]MDQ3500684.1 hypothetical protein [Actinomycetota bacterium]
MTNRKSDNEDESEILSDEQIEEGPASMADMAFKDRWEGGSFFADLQQRFGTYELDWTELEGLADDRPGLADRLAEATGMTKEAVMKEIEQAEKSTL